LATPCEKRERGVNLDAEEIFLTPSETKKRNLKLGVPSFLSSFLPEGRKEGRKKKGRKEGRKKKGRKEGRKEGRKKERKEGRKKERKEGRKGGPEISSHVA
jgi:hypothetical protein